MDFLEKQDYVFSSFNIEEREEKIKILEWIREEAICEIPENINGVPVKSIGKRAFSEKQRMQDVRFPVGLEVIEDYAFRECRGLKRINLGDCIKNIGNHAFYNCRSLTELRLSGELREIGDGAFKNCDGISHVYLNAKRNEVPAIKYILEELPQELMITIDMTDTNEKGVFVFPRDSVSFSEYTSRLYHPISYGVGNQYRMCAANGQIDYERYDFTFLRAMSEYADEILIRIALPRLMFPYQLDKIAKERYLNVIKSQAVEIAKLAIGKEKEDIFDYLLEAELLNQDEVDEVLHFAQDKNQVEISARIIEHRQLRFAKKKFEFDL